MKFLKLSKLGLIVLVGFVLRVVWLLVARPAPMSDYWEYWQLGIRLLELGQFGYPQPEAVRLPGYPAFLAMLMVVNGSVFWLSLCNVLLSTALIVIVYELALQLGRGDQLYARLCALACALYPTFVYYSPVLASEHLFVLIFFGGLLLLVRAGRVGMPSLATTIVAGLLLGASILTRGEGLFYLPAYLLAVLFSLGSLRARALRVVVIVVCALVVITPWYMRNVRLFGPGIGLAGSSGFAFYFSHNRYAYNYSDSFNNPELMSPSFVQSAKQGWARGLENLREDPAHVLRRMPIALERQYSAGEIPYAALWGSVRLHSLTASGWVTDRQAIPGLPQLDELARASYWLILILTAASFAFWRLLPTTSWLLLWSVIATNWFCYCVVFYAMDRYRFTAEVVACMLAAATLTGLAHLCRRRPFPKPSAFAAIVLVGLLLRVVWLLVAHPAPASDYLDYKNLGAWLLELGKFGSPEPEADRLPGYPAFLAMLMVVNGSVFWLSLCNVLLSTALIVILYQLALELGRGDLLYAKLCALVVALYPTFVFFSPVLASEHLFVLIFFGGLLLLVRAGRVGVPSMATTIVAGLLLGASILTRGEGLFYLPVYLLAILFSLGSLAARALRGAVVVLCALVVIMPWYQRNARLLGPGTGLSTSSGLAFYFSHNRYAYSYFEPWSHPELKAPNLQESAKRGWAEGLKYVREDPAHVLRRMPKAVAQQYAPGKLAFAVFWGSMKGHSYTPSGWVFERQAIPGLQQLDDFTRASYALILLLTAASLLFWRSLPATSWLLLWSVIAVNWLCYCVVFFAMDRYRFTAEVAATMLAAATMLGLVRLREHRLSAQDARRANA